MERTATWSRIGMDVSGIDTLHQVLTDADLNYNVVKRPIKTSDDIIIPGRVATVREDTGEVFGIVSPNYNICQNREAFDFVNYIEDDIKFERAGTTYYGLIYIIASLPEVKILGDGFKPYVIFQNGHTGGVSIRAAISPLRIACQNQFNMAFKNSDSTVNIKHNGAMYSRIESAREVLRSTAGHMKLVNAEAEKYAAIKLDEVALESLVEKLFPIKSDMPDKMKVKIMEKRAQFMRAHSEEDNQNFRGTAWGVVNAYSDYITHVMPSRKKDNWEDRVFSTVTLSPSMMQFISILNETVNVK